MGVRLSSAGYLCLLTIGVVAIVAGAVLGLTIGAADVDVHSVFNVFLDLFRDEPRSDSVAVSIIRDIRMPRILGGILVGGTLATVGTTLQAVMKNPLAEPYILGISSGASVGAALAVVVGAHAAGGPSASFGAFVAALLAVFVVYRVASVDGRVPAVRLLLAGVALSSFGTAVTGFLLYLSPEATQVRGIIFWLMGGLGGAEWSSVLWALGLSLPAVLLLHGSARWQNLLLLGDETAVSLGLDVARARGWLILIAALATGAMVAFAGAIGFIGLLVPHALRPFTGPDHRRLMPAAFLFGAVLLLVMDSLARVIIAPEELPVGILTGLLGAPFFLGQLSRQRDEADSE